jgi:hypothetical protein
MDRIEKLSTALGQYPYRIYYDVDAVQAPAPLRLVEVACKIEGDVLAFQRKGRGSRSAGAADHRVAGGGERSGAMTPDETRSPGNQNPQKISPARAWAP